MSAAGAELKLTYADIRAAIESYPEEWIRAAVRIENPDTGAPQRFDLWPAQQDVLEAMRRDRLLVILKARQLGLTWLALVYALWRMLTVSGYRGDSALEGPGGGAGAYQEGPVRVHPPSLLVRCP